MLISLLFLTGFAPLGQSTPEAQTLSVRITQVDTAQFPKVTVYVSVTDANGEPIVVSPSQLELRENGVIMTPDEVSGKGDIGPLTTLLVMDISGSMNSGGKLKAAQAAASAYVDQSRPGDEIGLLTFNTKTEYVQPLTSDRQALLQAIADLKARDDTAMYDTIARGIDILASTQGRKAIILLTDGLDNRSKKSPQEVIQMVSPQGLSVSIIGLGDPSHSKGSITALNEPALSALATQAGGVYGYANDAELAAQPVRALRARHAERICPHLHFALQVARWCKPWFERFAHRSGRRGSIIRSPDLLQPGRSGARSCPTRFLGTVPGVDRWSVAAARSAVLDRHGSCR